jgi:hypothetical protein
MPGIARGEGGGGGGCAGTWALTIEIDRSPEPARAQSVRRMELSLAVPQIVAAWLGLVHLYLFKTATRINIPL